MTGTIRQLVRDHRRRWTVLLGLIFFLLSSPSLISFQIGLPIVLLGETVRTWSSGFLEKNIFLQTRGPYAMTRHPLYLGNIIIGIGFAFIGNSVLGGILLLAGLYLIFTITMYEEEADLSHHFGKNYEDYVDRVPRLFPRWKRFDFSGFRWSRVMVNCELARWQRIVGGVFLFLVKGWIV